MWELYLMVWLQFLLGMEIWATVGWAGARVGNRRLDVTSTGSQYVRRLWSCLLPSSSSLATDTHFYWYYTSTYYTAPVRRTKATSAGRGRAKKRDFSPTECDSIKRLRIGTMQCFCGTTYRGSALHAVSPVITVCTFLRPLLRRNSQIGEPRHVRRIFSGWAHRKNMCSFQVPGVARRNLWS